MLDRADTARGMGECSRWVAFEAGGPASIQKIQLFIRHCDPANKVLMDKLWRDVLDRERMLEKQGSPR
jgi:hypothetical protein